MPTLNVYGRSHKVDLEPGMLLLRVLRDQLELHGTEYGSIVKSNFQDFPVPGIAEMPTVETLLVPSGGFWDGHGESAIQPPAPAVCNAPFAATGKRMRNLPSGERDLRTRMS